MNKLFLFAVLVISLTPFIKAQNIRVAGMEEITPKQGEEFYFPKFSNDDSQIILTKSNFKGLYSYDRSKHELKTLTDDNGAGYEFSISKDDQLIYYRADSFIKGRKYSKLIVQNLNDLSKSVIVGEQRDLSPPKILNDGSIFYTSQDRINILENKSFKRKSISGINTSFVTIEKCKIAFYQNGIKRELTPLGSGNYIWASLSPDKSKILFTLAGKGTFVSDLKGKILTKLGYADFPRWSPDGRWIAYMVDRDDGYTVTSSDLYVQSLDGSKTVKLTNTKEIHEMYPEWSSNGKEIICNTSEGRIFVLNIDEF